MADYQGKKIVIVGLGVTGLSCVDFFLGKGVCPQVMDTRAQPPGYQQLAADVPYHYGSWQTDWLNQADIIVVNPGLSIALPPLQTAKQHGAQIIGDIELFCREASAPIIAITGSNGKSTVTTLVGEMAKQANWSVGVGGNIGLPALSLLKQPCQLYVLELSSFQLETTYSLAAVAATILNISDDHLDRYPQGISQYCAAKQRIYQGAKLGVFNAEDEQTRPVSSSTQQLISVGIQQGEYHVAQQTDQLWLQQGSTPLINCAELPLVGLHNYFNALAALALADAAQIPRSASLQALRQFSGLAHRLQIVHQQDGVRWINDSKATNIGSTIAALRGLTTAGRIHLLLGGDGKGADFSPLAAYLQQTNLAIYCYGQDKAQLAALRPEITQITDTMAQAMQLIRGQLQAGDLVLLSPACASWDQFANFEHRGNEFTRLAKELSQ